ncbi:MAG: hypothetical protein M1833_007233 [Piccolia ochrophora]|nr:MAG: hypothetical protein M1833_007233 [Piccolia ochrophora]
MESSFDRIEPEVAKGHHSYISAPLKLIPEPVLRQKAKCMGDEFPGLGDNITKVDIQRLRVFRDEIVQTAASQGINSSHRAAACNALCALIGTASSSRSPGIRVLCREATFWHEALEMYLDCFDRSKVKSMRQILSSLCIVLKDSVTSTSAPERTAKHALQKLLTRILGNGPRGQVRAALHALEFFLRKEVISLYDLISMFMSEMMRREGRESVSLGTSGNEHLGVQKTTAMSETRSLISITLQRAWLERLLGMLLDWISHSDVAPAAGDLISNLCLTWKSWREISVIHDEPNSQESAAPIWAIPLQNYARTCPEHVEDLKSHVLPGLFRTDVEDLNRFFTYLSFRNVLSGKSSPTEGDSTLLFVSLHVGKELGLVVESGSSPLKESSKTESNKIILPNALLGELLSHGSTFLRASALSLLVTSKSTTKPFTSDALDLIINNLSCMFDDADSKFRGDIISILRRLTERLRGSLSVGFRDVERRHRAFNKSDSVGVLPLIDSSPVDQDLKTHTSFVKRYIKLLHHYLQPTANFQQHITALKALGILIQSGLDRRITSGHLSRQAQIGALWPVNIPVFTATTTRLLLDLLMDPFDEVRAASEAMLRVAPSNCLHPTVADMSHLRAPNISPQTSAGNLNKTSRSCIELFLSRATRTMQQTARADHSDGVARGILLSSDFLKQAVDAKTSRVFDSSPKTSHFTFLVSWLETDTALLRVNLAQALSAPSLHAILGSLRYILEQKDAYRLMETMSSAEVQCWCNAHKRMIKACQDIWHCFRGIVCVDSPEGHKPDGFESHADIGTKDILSYAWRSVKESSLLLRTIISFAPFNDDTGSSILQQPDFSDIGGLSFLQLAELRHRGAFSTVTLTFAACCERCSSSWHQGVRALPLSWYTEAIDCIHNKATVITRRSAGLPALVVGILSADKETRLFERCFSDLQRDALLPLNASTNQKNVKLPQVHALNCMKEVFKSTKLGTVSELYISGGLEIAAKSMKSEVWDVRNCGVMLFRALIDRIFGTNEAENMTKPTQQLQSSRMSYARFPNLADLLLELLDAHEEAATADNQSHASDSIVESVFPSLEILKRAQPPGEIYQKVQSQIVHHLGSKVWLVRDMSARAYASLVPPKDASEHIRFLLEHQATAQNLCHGILVAVMHICKSTLVCGVDGKREITEITKHVMDGHHRFFLLNSCLITRAAYLDVVNFLLQFHLQEPGTQQPIVEQIVSLSSTVVKHCLWYQELDTEAGQREAHRSTWVSTKATFAINETLTHYFHQDWTALQGLILDISNDDPNTACLVLEHLRVLLVSNQQPKGHLHELRVMANVHSQLQLACTSNEVQVVVSQLFALLLENVALPEVGAWIKPLLELGRLEPSQPKRHQLKNSSPSLFNISLRLRGSTLALDCLDNEHWSATTRESIKRWNHLVGDAGHERNDFTTREASALSLRAFKSAFRSPLGAARAHKVLLDSYLILYDILNDDDDEIRGIGAEVASWILYDSAAQTPNTVLVPSAAAFRLSKWLATRYSSSQDLFHIGLSRLVGAPLIESASAPSSSASAYGSTIRIPPFADILAQARKEDVALFMEEKQNLYIDPIREATLWSNVIQQLRDTAFDAELASMFADWVLQGLDNLLRTAHAELDGPLGWTSKPDVYALGMRVILGAGILILWAIQGLGEARDVQVKTTLQMLREAGKENELHPLWVEKIDRILEGVHE